MSDKERLSLEKCQLPSELFSPLAEKDREFITYKSELSGKKINVEKYRNFIRVSDSRDPDVYFVMLEVDRDGVMSSQVRTRSRGKPHPDLFATKILLREYDYLVANGNRPHQFKDIWKSTGQMTTNYRLFKRALRERGCSLSDLIRKHGGSIGAMPGEECFELFEQAVRETWTWSLTEKMVKNPQVAQVMVFRRDGGADIYGFDYEDPFEIVYVYINFEPVGGI